MTKIPTWALCSTFSNTTQRLSTIHWSRTSRRNASFASRLRRQWSVMCTVWLVSIQAHLLSDLFLKTFDKLAAIQCVDYLMIIYIQWLFTNSSKFSFISFLRIGLSNFLSTSDTDDDDSSTSWWQWYDVIGAVVAGRHSRHERIKTPTLSRLRVKTQWAAVFCRWQMQHNSVLSTRETSYRFLTWNRNYVSDVWTWSAASEPLTKKKTKVVQLWKT